MDDHATLMRLEELAYNLGIPVRYENIKPDDEEPAISGGLCRLNGEPIIIINTGATTKEKILALSLIHI